VYLTKYSSNEFDQHNPIALINQYQPRSHNKSIPAQTTKSINTSPDHTTNQYQPRPHNQSIPAQTTESQHLNLSTFNLLLLLHVSFIRLTFIRWNKCICKRKNVRKKPSLHNQFTKKCPLKWNSLSRIMLTLKQNTFFVIKITSCFVVALYLCLLNTIAKMTRIDGLSLLSNFVNEQFFKRDYMSVQVCHLETKFEVNVGLKYFFSLGAITPEWVLASSLTRFVFFK
jgi:hypothetical protein